MKHSKILLSATLGLGLAVGMTAMPAAASAPPAPTGDTSEHPATSGYLPTPGDQAANKAFFKAVMKSVKAKQAISPRAASVTVTYDASQAPTFAAQIASSAQIWNSHVSNVQLQAGGNADFSYREGDDPQGSYASTDGHGNGYIFLDYAQNQEYDSTRVTAHETGHVLGLPDHYEGPCSELMSGGGPGPSCTNSNPDQTESGKVNELWANGLAAFDKTDFMKAS
ncbi:snapalysin [Streptomyces sp. H27-D2]|uniref:snapalysin n=1 Tax=Streptomyces sp. H27-D2 TaxID=3046304 RepID=UPI002DB6E577|nr:snapalysin [Streptomyces sp. H27-D2]MEC4016209.1 snapalysin [Streptomyces sp. H27-D2]